MDSALFSDLQDIVKFSANVWKTKLLPWFTNHDPDHSREIIFILGQLLKPLENHKAFLDEHELFVLLASAFLHDIGMQFLKLEEIPIEKLTEKDYNEIRKKHAELSSEIILKKVATSSGRDDFHLPTSLNDAYIAPIAFVCKGHSTDFFEEVLASLKDGSFTPKGRPFRGELLAALLLIADELDLQCKRVDFDETTKFNLSVLSKVHWYKHHYVDNVGISKNALTITLRFPSNSTDYSSMVRELIDTKLVEQIKKVNPHLRECTEGVLFLDDHIEFNMKIDSVNVKREMPPEVLTELKRLNGRISILPLRGPDASFGDPSIPEPPALFTGIVEKKGNGSVQSGEVSSRKPEFSPKNYFFSVPYREKGEQFVGQSGILDKVYAQLFKGKRMAIGQSASFIGLGGLGKTQVAVEYAYHNKSCYPNGVIWINADSDIDSQLIEYSVRALWISQNADHKDKLEVAKQRIKSYSDCLIIFDNVESTQSIAAYLPEPTAEPHIIITSRIEHPGFPPITIDLLDETQSLELLFQEIGREAKDTEELQAAKDIAEILSGLPLALEIAGAFLRYRPILWEKYLNLLKVNLKAALPPKFQNVSFTKHEADLFSTLKINEEIFLEEPTLRQILDLLTWSGSSPMCQSLMCFLLSKEPTEVANALAIGFALKILKGNHNEQCFSIHRLLRDVRRQDLPLNERKMWVQQVCQKVVIWFKEKRQNFADLDKFEKEIDHLKEWEKNARYLDLEVFRKLVWLQAYPAFHRGNFLEAKTILDETWNIDLYQEDAEFRAHLLHDLGTVYLSFEKFSKGLEFLAEALEIRQNLFGQDNPDVALSLSNMAAAQFALDNTETAKGFAEKSLKIYEELFGNSKFEIARPLALIGYYYLDRNKLSEARGCFEKCLSLAKSSFGENDPNTANAYFSFGIFLMNEKSYDESLENFNKALIIQESLLGKKSPEYAKSIIGFGLVFKAQGKLAQAKEKIQEGNGILISYFGENYSWVAANFSALGRIFSKECNWEKAIESFLNSFLINKDIFGDLHNKTVTSKINLIYSLRNAGKFHEALKSLNELKKILPKDHHEFRLLENESKSLVSKISPKGFRKRSK